MPGGDETRSRAECTHGLEFKAATPQTGKLGYRWTIKSAMTDSFPGYALSPVGGDYFVDELLLNRLMRGEY